jgi:hypothetical protein
MAISLKPSLFQVCNFVQFGIHPRLQISSSSTSPSLPANRQPACDEGGTATWVCPEEAGVNEPNSDSIF